MRKYLLVAAGAAMVSTQAYAADKFVVQPVQVGAETARFDQGHATVDLEEAHGAVQVRPMAFDHGSVVFGIAVYNDGQAPANIDLSNVAVRVNGQPVALYSADELAKRAKHRAMWTQIGLAALGGVAAAAAASQRDHYRSTFVTPHGVYHSSFSAPSAGGQVAAAAAIAGTGVGIARVQQQLDNTLDAIDGETVQLTTVDPGDSYAGQIVVAKTKLKGAPDRIDMLVSWNGEQYPFAFQVAKRGTPAPVFAAITPSPPPATKPAVAPASAQPAVVTPATQAAPVVEPSSATPAA